MLVADNFDYSAWLETLMLLSLLIAIKHVFIDLPKDRSTTENTCALRENCDNF